MSRIKIKNLGPINNGLSSNEGWIDIRKITVFTGNQGSGKSTVAKLISTLSWMEKGFVRGDLPWGSLDNDGQFQEFCAYQKIRDYFRPNTEISFEGHSIDFHFSSGKVSIIEKQSKQYFVPKIMYVPAERNFIGAVSNLNNIKDLPGTVYTFSDEYRKALKEVKERVKLPINDVYFEYNQAIDIPAIGTEDYLIELSSASSGFQSAVPLFIVTRYLAESIRLQRKSSAQSETTRLTLEQEERIRKELQEIRDNQNLSENIKRLQIELLSSRFENSHFLNVVEEPEQNLYPTSQKEILFSLLKYNNLEKGNQLVITTHSPFLINYLILAVKGGQVFASKKNLEKDILKSISDIVPKESSISVDDLAIYEMDGNRGTIQLLETVNGLPSDENNLNEELDEFNELYAQLVELQFSNG